MAPAAFDADRLPPSLGISTLKAPTLSLTPSPDAAPATDAAPASEAASEEKPRRRRVRVAPDEVQAN